MKKRRHRTKDIMLSKLIQETREYVIQCEFHLEYLRYQLDRLEGGETDIGNDREQVISEIKDELGKADTTLKLGIDKLTYYKQKRDIDISKRAMRQHPESITVKKE